MSNYAEDFQELAIDSESMSDYSEDSEEMEDSTDSGGYTTDERGEEIENRPRRVISLPVVTASQGRGRCRRDETDDPSYVENSQEMEESTDSDDGLCTTEDETDEEQVTRNRSERLIQLPATSHGRCQLESDDDDGDVGVPQARSRRRPPPVVHVQDEEDDETNDEDPPEETRNRSIFTFEQWLAMAVNAKQRPKVERHHNGIPYQYEKLGDLKTTLKREMLREYRCESTNNRMLPDARFVYGVVTELVETPYKDYICVRISDETLEGVHLRLCDDKRYPAPGPTVSLYDIIRVHRVTVQEEFDGRGQDMVLSIGGHRNYCLFYSGHDELQVKSSAKTIAVLDSDRRRINELIRFAVTLRQRYTGPATATQRERRTPDEDVDRERNDSIIGMPSTQTQQAIVDSSMSNSQDEVTLGNELSRVEPVTITPERELEVMEERTGRLPIPERSPRKSPAVANTTSGDRAGPSSPSNALLTPRADESSASGSSSYASARESVSSVSPPVSSKNKRKPCDSRVSVSEAELTSDDEVEMTVNTPAPGSSVQKLPSRQQPKRHKPRDNDDNIPSSTPQLRNRGSLTFKFLRSSDVGVSKTRTQPKRTGKK